MEAKWDRIRFLDVFWWPVYRYRFRCCNQLSVPRLIFETSFSRWNVKTRKEEREHTIRRSNNLFELSLHPANMYFPSRSNSTDVISPKQSASVWTHIPPIASHNLICLSLPLFHQYSMSTLTGIKKKTYPEARSFPVLS